MPTGRQIHIDVPLSNIAVAAFNTGGDFVAGKLFPPVRVNKQSDKYYTLDQDTWLLTPTTYRAPKTNANKIEFKVSSDSYFADNYALGTDNALEDLDNADEAVDLRITSTNLVVVGLQRDFEVRAAAKAISNVTSVSRLTGANAWDAVNSADIVTQVRDARLAIQALTGLKPNAAIIDWKSLQYAKGNSIARDYKKYVTKGENTVDELAALFEIDNLYVANSMKNNAYEGATASLTSIWGPTFMLFVQGPAAKKTATYGLGFRWRNGASTDFSVTKQVFSGAGTKNVEVIEASYFQDEKVISNNLGFYINTKSGSVW